MKLFQTSNLDIIKWLQLFVIIMPSKLIELRSTGFLVRHSTVNNAICNLFANKLDVYELDKLLLLFCSSVYAAFILFRLFVWCLCYHYWWKKSFILWKANTLNFFTSVTSVFFVPSIHLHSSQPFSPFLFILLSIYWRPDNERHCKESTLLTKVAHWLVVIWRSYLDLLTSLETLVNGMLHGWVDDVTLANPTRGCCDGHDEKINRFGNGNRFDSF